MSLINDIQGRYISWYLLKRLDSYLISAQYGEAEKLFKRMFAIHPSFHAAIMQRIKFLYYYKGRNIAVAYAKKHNKLYTVRPSPGPIKADVRLNEKAWKAAKVDLIEYKAMRTYKEIKVKGWKTEMGFRPGVCI